MCSETHFSLRWNNFGSTMTSALNKLQQLGDFVDVTLAVEGTQLRAHKVVLSACSPYFRNILKSNPCQHPVIILREVDVEDLESVLTFIYEGEVNVSQPRLHTFMRLAEALQVKGLTEYHNEKPDYQSYSHNSHNNNYSAREVSVKNSSHKRSSLDSSACNNMIYKKRKFSEIQKPSSPFNLNSTDFELQEMKISSGFLEEVSPEEKRDSPHSSGETEPHNSPSKVNEDSSNSQTLAEKKTTSNSNSLKGDKQANNYQPEFPQDPSCHHTLPYPCPFCEKSYTSWGFRRRHIKGYHTGSPELPCKWCLAILPSHQEWESHVTRIHSLTITDARNGILILEEAHMVLQIAQPTRIDSLMELIKNKKLKDKEEEKESENDKEKREKNETQSSKREERGKVLRAKTKSTE
ncbi:Broad-complex core protein isoforms 1/2/3/4/5 [Armadillidium vulgare]|nr:Broad-complex core protein isoforms 1/2/3/4/5 [Armadillidium vulgare]